MTCTVTMRVMNNENSAGRNTEAKNIILFSNNGGRSCNSIWWKYNCQKCICLQLHDGNGDQQLRRSSHDRNSADKLYGRLTEEANVLRLGRVCNGRRFLYFHAASFCLTSLQSRYVRNDRAIFAYVIFFKTFFLIDTREKDIDLSLYTWRHRSHIGVAKHWNGGHVSVPNQSCESINSFLTYTLSFAPINLHGSWTREWIRSIDWKQ